MIGKKLRVIFCKNQTDLQNLNIWPIPILIKFCKLKAYYDDINFFKFQLSSSYTLETMAIQFFADVSKNGKFDIFLRFKDVFLTQTTNYSFCLILRW